MPKGKQLTDAERAKRDEERADNFKDLFVKRVNKVLDAIGPIGNLANRNSYVYTPEQVKAGYDAVCKELDRTFGRFQPDAKQATGGFSLDTVGAAETDAGKDKES